MEVRRVEESIVNLGKETLKVPLELVNLKDLAHAKYLAEDQVQLFLRRALQILNELLGYPIKMILRPISVAPN